MRRTALVVTVGVLLFGVSGVQAQDTIIDGVMKACDAEIQAYCSQVSPGEGRLLACFYAHGDKLSGQCEYALYDAAAQARAVRGRGHLRRAGVPRGPARVLRRRPDGRRPGRDLPGRAQGAGQRRVPDGDRRRRAGDRRGVVRTAARRHSPAGFADADGPPWAPTPWVRAHWTMR
ncbi:MAG: hypothetical protein GWN51_00030, partial [Gemmatimonadetes bacterium]|nr:hypothetical protein [Gemmatimonadota bacterium]